MPKHWKVFCGMCFGAGFAVGIAFVVGGAISVFLAIVCVATMPFAYHACKQTDRALAFICELEDLNRIADPVERLEKLTRIRNAWEGGNAD